MSQEEQIEKELEEKSIERDAFDPMPAKDSDDATTPIREEIKEEAADAGLLQQDVEPSPPPKKSKKVRSEKQKAAFEKARKARAEKIALKKKQKEEDKIKKKEAKKNPLPLARQGSVADPPQPIIHRPQPTIPTRDKTNSRTEVVNNYYYYGGFAQPPPSHQPLYHQQENNPPAPARKPPTPEPSSESSEEEQEYYQPSLQDSYPQAYKFNYA